MRCRYVYVNAILLFWITFTIALSVQLNYFPLYFDTIHCVLAPKSAHSYTLIGIQDSQTLNSWKMCIYDTHLSTVVPRNKKKFRINDENNLLTSYGKVWKIRYLVNVWDFGIFTRKSGTFQDMIFFLTVLGYFFKGKLKLV